jgi:uncharacterized protein YecT (DUF1311 family)
MKIFVATILTLCFYSTSLAQKLDFKNVPWEIGCDSLSTQTEMNICSYEKFKIADSILNSYYDTLIKFVDSEYLQQLKQYTDPTDTSQKDYVQQLKEQKNAIIKSKKDFQEYLNSTTEIINYQYKGGTIRPLMVNSYALDLTVNQIKILLKIMEEIINK